MSSLPRLQADFQNFLLRTERAVEAEIVGTARVPAQTRLGIYFDGYRARLTDALAANYPILCQLVGEVDFAGLCGHYIRQHDSVFASIRYYGQEMADFLAREPEYAEAPLLVDLARWEWAITETFDAADAEPIGADALAQVEPDAWADLRFDWHPALRRLDLEWNAPQIWRALNDEVERPEATFGGVPVPWLLWRRELSTYFRSLARDEAEMLDGARAGRTFGELCEQLSETWGEEQTASQAATYLRTWVESGLITAVR